MRRGLLVVAALCCSYALLAQTPMSIRVKEPVICYAGADNPHYVAPLDASRKSKQVREGATQSSVFEVTYIGFENVPQAQAAFQTAVDIWSSLLTSSVPIRIEARWTNLASDVLGSANYTYAYANFRGAQKLNVYYPVAIAEKITGQEMNGADADIVANFNSNFNWNYDPNNTNIPFGQYDLTTVVLHEFGHGLGFSGTMTVDGTQGSFGLWDSDTPIVYDAFIQNGSTTNLIQGFTSPSSAMRTELTGGTLFFKGANETSKLYAPNSFDPGSSISHLDDDFFDGSDDALMTHAVGARERIRSAGVALDILNDLGWEIVHIRHTRLPDTENLTGPFTVSAVIEGDNGFDDSSPTLHYTLNGNSFTTVPMTDQGNNVFTANIPSQNIARSYGYYISVSNGRGTEYVNPGKVVRLRDSQLQNFFTFKAGTDTEAPIVRHAKVPYLLNTETELNIVATISDNSGLVDAVLEYAINDGQAQELDLILTSPPEDSVYTATLLTTDLVNGDKIRYQIIATDRSSNHNRTVSPEEDEYVVDVVGLGVAQATYETTFADPTRDQEFFGTGFSITTPDGFMSRALHSEHPYVTGQGFPNNEREIIYQLRIPVIVSSTGATLNFDEIALVEPGASGSVFGDSDFFDYVIVEGSKDGGETWEYLLNGYDAKHQSVWLTRFNSAINSEGSSTAVGDPELYRKRRINLLETFEADDEIFIRFRMYIDQLAVGWGWAIDNLAIQTVITDAEPDLNTSTHIYPNPAQKDLVIESIAQSDPDFSIQLFTLQGQRLYESTDQAVNGKMVHTIDLQQLPTGLYVVKVLNGEQTTVKKVLKLN